MLYVVWVTLTAKMKSGNWQRAFILHRRPYSETSLLLDLFTENQGRMSLIAKGVCKKRSLLKGILQPFTPLLVQWSGRGGLKTLCNAEAISLPLPLTDRALYCGIYINELLSHLLQREIEFTQLFFDYLSCIQSLAIDDKAPEPALRRFELALLEHLGYGTDFLYSVENGDSIDENKTYLFQINRGFFAMPTLEESRVSEQLQQFSGRNLKAFHLRDFSEEDNLKAAKRFTRLVLGFYLDGKRLKSQELFRTFVGKSYRSSL